MYKDKVRESTTIARNYKLCDQVTEEMTVIKKRKRECEQELVIWEKKQQKGSWYRKKSRVVKSVSTGPGNSESCMSDPESDSELHQYLPPHPAGKTAIYLKILLHL